MRRIIRWITDLSTLIFLGIGFIHLMLILLNVVEEQYSYVWLDYMAIFSILVVYYTVMSRIRKEVLKWALFNYTKLKRKRIKL